jgi:hypothetical protein
MILALRVSEGSEDRENDRSSLPRRGHFFQAKSWKKPRTYIVNHIFNTLKALDYAKPEGEIFNSATTEKFTAGEAARIGAEIAGVAPEPKAFEKADPPAGPGHRVDTAKLLRLIGPSPVSIREGLRRYHRARLAGIETPQDWMFEPEAK